MPEGRIPARRLALLMVHGLLEAEERLAKREPPTDPM
jgi:hypothetical protein